MSTKEMKFVSACKDFFGVLPGQTPMEFLKEVKQLTPEDRADITVGLEKNGYKIITDTVAG